jgi:hypothetical protein
MSDFDNSTLDILTDDYNVDITTRPRLCWEFNDTLNDTLNATIPIPNCTDYDASYHFEGEGWINPFHVPHIRALFITAYSIVFAICVVGK